VAVTAAELQRILIDLLVGAAGGTAERWTGLLGPIEQRPAIENIHSNWRVKPKAKGEELRAIRNAVDLVRDQHPYVD
jgi:hypothetical protein